MKKKIININILIFIYFILNAKFYNENVKCPKDELTIVTAFYEIKSKHSYLEYLSWISNFVLLDKSIVFFTNKKFMHILKKIRPKKLHYKTVFFELEIENFYTYKYFYKEFNKSFYMDEENKYHSVPLYMIWAEKSMFLKRAIINNYFNSKCFYWIDIGYFHENITEMEKYIHKWPSTEKCYEDKRVLLGQVNYFSDSDKKKIINFDLSAHYKLQRHTNVIGGLFGGKANSILKFVDLYYKAIKIFSKKGLFIGKDQNIYTYVAFAHPELVNLVLLPNYRYFKVYLA